MNSDYGKLENGILTYAPTNVEIGDVWYIPAQPEHLLEAGYMQIIHTPYPTDGKYYTSHFEISEGNIVEVWEETDPPSPLEDPMTDLEEMTIDHEYRLTLLELGV